MNFFKELVNAIIEVEKNFIDLPKSGKQKKEKVIELINKMVDIPIIPEFIEKKIFDIIVDLVIFIFNEYNLFDKT